MFRGYSILSRAAFRVTRNSNLYMQEEEARSVLESVRRELHNRRKGDAVRMEIEAFAAEEIAERLRINFELEPWQVFRTNAPVNLSRLMSLYSAAKHARAQVSPSSTAAASTSIVHQPPTNIFDALRKDDILLHHPFDSYSTVEDFIGAAAHDPDVISIKQTLYRTSADSPIFSALTEAAQTKDVTVVVELMARFDEASNIRWARELEDAGVQVFHGIFGLKTHCKLALIVRRDSDGVIRSYAHLGTGNYNPVTARFYTDISLLTARPELTDAVLRVFRYLTADWEAGPNAYRPLLVAPVTLATDILALIAREADTRQGRKARAHHRQDERACSTAPPSTRSTPPRRPASKSTSSSAACARLRPGVPGLSERIRVRSIVGRFLEHSRIFFFANGGREARNPKSSAAAPTGCPATSTSAARSSSPSSTQPSSAACATRSSKPISATTSRPASWTPTAPTSAPPAPFRPSAPSSTSMDLSRTPDKRLTRDKTAAVESTPAEDAESILSKEQSGL